MEKTGQMIISISREYGSGGHYIAEKLSKELDMELLDRSMLDAIAKEKGVDPSELRAYDEMLKPIFLSRTVKGMSNSMEDNVAEMQFEYIQRKADEGKNIIVVGRCGDYVLRKNPNLTKIFIMGDMDEKVKRIMEVRNMDETQAKKTILRHDSNRRAYHNLYSEKKWGDSRYYELLINSSKLGVDDTAELIKQYILKKYSK